MSSTGQPLQTCFSTKISLSYYVILLVIQVFSYVNYVAELYQYTTSKGIITQKSIIRDLGIYIYETLKWSPHINIDADNARKMASWVLNVFKDRSRSTMLTLYTSMVRSRLEYCCPLWDPSYIEDIRTLEDVQQSFANKITSVNHLSYWDRIKCL